MHNLFISLSLVANIEETNKLKNTHFNFLVETTFKIANTYFQKRYTKVHFLSNFMNCELSDFAIDSISPLFIKNGNNEYPIIKSFTQWDPKISNEKEALQFLNNLVSCRVEQHISKLLKEFDPIFSRIMDSMNYQIKKNNLTKLKFLGQTYAAGSEFDFEKDRLITTEEIEEMPAEIIFTDSEHILNTINYFMDDNGQLSAIPLNALIYKIKYAKVAELPAYISSESIEKKIDAEEIVEISLAEAVNKLTAGYYKKNKLNECEFETFKKILDDIAADLKNGGVKPGFYKYFLQYDESLTKEEYLDKYHNKIEYLYKIIKKSIISQFE